MSEHSDVSSPRHAAVRSRSGPPGTSGPRRWASLVLSGFVMVGGILVLPVADAREFHVRTAAGPVLNDGVTTESPVPLQEAGIDSASAPQPVPSDPVTGSRVVDTAVTTALPDGRAATAIAAAMAQIGLPYVWGGDGPTGGDAGFDCSGLTTYAYRIAGIRLPRTAHTQYYAGPRIPAGASLQPGDLVFYGTTARVHHVGMYIGDGRMVNAPRRGKPVQVAYYRWRGDDYLGASRPAADGPIGSAPLPYVPPVPLPEAPVVPPEFLAPPAPLPPVRPAPTDPQPPESETAAQSVEESASLIEVPPPVLSLGSALRPTPGPGTAVEPEPASGAATSSGVPGSASTAQSLVGNGGPGDPVSPVNSTGPTSPPLTPVTPAPATSAPVAPAPVTPAPVTPAPATTTSRPDVPAPPTAEPEPIRATALVLPGGTAELRAVRLDAAGLPRAAGIRSDGGRHVVRLAEWAGTVPGSPVTLRFSDGSSRTYMVGAVTTATAGAATAVAGSQSASLVILVPTGESSWTVLTAG